MIPDAAVEAAHKAWREQANTPGTIFEYNLRAALEAAAPHLMAQAWSDGAQAGFSVTREGFNGECAYEHCADDDYPPTNPHGGEPWKVAE